MNITLRAYIVEFCWNSEHSVCFKQLKYAPLIGTCTNIDTTDQFYQWYIYMYFYNNFWARRTKRKSHSLYYTIHIAPARQRLMKN